MSLKDQIKGRVEAFDAWARPWTLGAPWRAGAHEFLLFGLKQAWACLFAGTMLALLVATSFWWPQDAVLARYDSLVLAAVGLQVLLLATGLERPREALVIAIFHLVGTAILTAFFIWIAENLGTYASAWVYPDQADGWTPVSLAKMGSWYLLMMLSFVLVTLVHPPRRAERSS